MTTTSLSPIEKWEADFEKSPLLALDSLLLRHVFMGRLQRNETAEILFRLFHGKGKEMQHMLDMAMHDWFKRYWTLMPSFISTTQWAEVLQDAFSAVQRMNLRQSYQWLRRMYSCGCLWLRSLYLHPARDPEAALLRTLALGQTDRELWPLWMRLCGLEENLPLHYASIGLLGLRKLPEKNGEPPGDLPQAVFRGIVNLAEAINNQSRLYGEKEGEDFWFLECRAIMAAYPRSVTYWIDHFYPAIYCNPKGMAAKWLSKLIPGILKRLCKNEQRRSIVKPPTRVECEDIEKLLESRLAKEIRPKLDEFIERHRFYTGQTGDAESLVKAFCRISDAIFDQNTDLVLSLMKEAFHWAPYDPFVWTIRAKVEAYQSNHSGAAGLLWEAKRRFPENDTIRNSLANELKKQGKYKIAEVIYRQAMQDFPKDMVCRNGLGEVLKAQNRLEKAEAVYRKAMRDFPNNVVCRTGLGEVLKAQNRLEEAETVYREAMRDFPNNVVCRTGLAGVLLPQGKREDAIILLEETGKKFPGSRINREFLEKISGTEKITDISVIYNEELSEVMATKFGSEPLQESPEFMMSPPELETACPSDTASRHLDQSRSGENKKDSLQTEIDLDDNAQISECKEIETEIGLANLFRLASRWAEGEEKEQYSKYASEVLEEILRKVPNHITCLLEKGWWLLDQRLEEAEDFYTHRVAQCPHVLGFRLGQWRVKNIKGEKSDPQQWDNLINAFSANSTIINLECSMQELHSNGNGNALAALENLRKQLRKDVKQLPRSIQGSEKWVVGMVSQSLFKKIDITKPLTESDLPYISDNHKKHGATLKGIIEQCLSIA